MSDDALRRADAHFAQGDYLRALDELQKGEAFDPEIADRIHAALERMKVEAAREFAAGRWSVAEGIFDAVRESERFLTPAERAECRILALEIGRCRDRERQMQGAVQAATALAARGKFPEAREVALQMMQGCGDPLLVARLRRILGDLPHPLGRLLYGFDSPLEVDQFVRVEGDASAEAVVEENHPLGGAFLRVRFPREGSSVVFLDPPPDWTDARELSLCVRLVFPARAALRVSAGGWTHEARIIDPYWNQVRIPLDRFQKTGEADWGRVTRFEISSASGEPGELFLDEVRLKARTAPRETP